MHRLIDCVFRQADFSRRRRFAALAVAALVAFALPAAAQANQTLTVQEVGSGAGTVTSSPAGIECGQACSFDFPDSTSVILKGAPALHSQAVRWSGCDKVTFKNECVLAMSAAKAVIARFDILPEWAEYTITVQRTGSGQGTVQSSPAGIECGEDCSETYLHYTQLTLSATPAPGSVFAHWSGGGCEGQTGPCSISVTSSKLVKAVFTAVGVRTLAVAKAGRGQGTVTSAPAGIECGAVCSADFDAATKVTLKATPAPGSTFAGWSGGGCAGAGACKLAMNEARSVTATFTKPGGGPSELLVAGRAKVKAGRALLRLACESASPCQGSLKLLIKIRNAQGQTKGLVVAQGSYALAAGARQTLEVKLSPRARRLLAGAASLRARVTGTGIDSHAVRLAA